MPPAGDARRRSAARRLHDLQHAVRRGRQPETVLEESCDRDMRGPRRSLDRRLRRVLLRVAGLVDAQNRGVYPLGMSATNSGVTPATGVHLREPVVVLLRATNREAPTASPSATGNNSVILAMNSFVWVSRQEVLGGARFSMSATLPISNNSLSSDAAGAISGGGGFADSYFQPFILGWNRERVAVRAIYGFLAPTGVVRHQAQRATSVRATGPTSSPRVRRST